MSSTKSPIPNKYYLSLYTSIVLNKIREFRNITSGNLYEEFPFRSTKKLLQLITRILARYEEDIRVAWSEYGNRNVLDLMRKLETINFIVCNTIPLLLEAAHKSVNVSLVLPIIDAYQEVIRQVRFGSNAIIFPSYEYNATFYDAMALAREMSGFHDEETKQAIFTGAPPYFAIISYPWAEESDVLRQSLIAHEVAHFVDLELGWSEKLKEEQIFTQQDLDDIDNAAKNLSVEMKISPKDIVSVIRQLLSEMVSNWYKEFVSDYLAVCIIGPAYLFAFDEFTFGIESKTDIINGLRGTLATSHPPSSLRKNLIKNLCQNIYFSKIDYRAMPSNHGSIISEYKKRIERIKIAEEQFSGIDDIENLPNQFTDLVYQILKSKLMLAQKILNAKYLKSVRSEPWFFNVNMLKASLPLVDLLRNDLIPSDQYKALSFAAIINAGWMYLSMYREDFSYDYRRRDNANLNFDLKYEKYRTLQRLLSKAIETNRFMEIYSSRKGDK